jgi:hypothetical protein
MSNTAKPNGLSPWRYLNGAPWNGQANIYHIPVGYATKIAIGDPVKSVATSDANGVPDVVIATATTDILRGVVVGWLPSGAGIGVSLVGSALALESTTGPVSTDKYVLVVDDPTVIFKAQLDNGATPGSAALSTMVTKNIKANTLTYATGTNVSTTSLDTTSFLATLATSLKCMGLVVGPENAGVDVSVGTGQNAWVQVKINMHELAGGVGTAGI